MQYAEAPPDMEKAFAPTQADYAQYDQSVKSFSDEGGSVKQGLTSEHTASYSDKDDANKNWWTRLRQSRFIAFFAFMEKRGIEPVPEEEQTLMSMWRIVLSWIGMNVNILTFATGTLPPLSGMGLRSSFYTIVGFTLFTSLVPAYFCTFGPRLGMRQMIQARYSFGYFGACIIALAECFNGICYNIFNAILAGEALEAVSPKHGDDYSLSSIVGIVIMTVIAFVVAACGINVLHYMEMYMWIPMTISFAILAGEVKSGPEGLHTVHPEPHATSRDILGMGVVYAGFQLSYGAMASDVSIYLRRNYSSTRLFIACLLAIAIPTTCILLLGAAFAASAQTIPEWQELLDKYPSPGPLLDYLLAGHLGNFGKFLVVLIALSAIGNMAVTFYYLSIDLHVFFPPLSRLPRIAMTVLSFAITLPVAIAGRNKFYETLDNLVSIIAYWCALYSGVVLADHCVIRRLNFESYDPAIYNQWSKLPPGIAGIGSCVLSLGLVIPFIDQTWFVGPLAKLHGDLGIEIGFVLTFLLYIILRPIEMRIFKR